MILGSLCFQAQSLEQREKRCRLSNFSRDSGQLVAKIMKTYALDEIAKHNKAGDCWIIIDNKVYDVSNFLKEHPGGQKVVLKLAGKDATKEFKNLHGPDVLPKYSPQLYIGDVATSASSTKVVCDILMNNDFRRRVQTKLPRQSKKMRNYLET
jgi:cytochrome b involved in lipid metabolism